MKRISPSAILLVTLVMVSPHPTHADELKLKDGTKIVGTIVGFEENSFKVKTNYGFAVVQKDQVLSISITDSGKKLDSEKKSEPSAEKPVPPAPGVNSYKKNNTASSTSPPAAPAADPNTSDPKTASSNTSPASAATATTAKAATTTAPTPAKTQHRPLRPLSLPLRPPRLRHPNQCVSV